MEEVHFQVVYSFSFGGRGCFFSGSQIPTSQVRWCCPVVDLRSGGGLQYLHSPIDAGVKESESDILDGGSRIYSRCRRPCNYNAVLLLFLSVMVVTIIIITNVFGFATVFDKTLGFPGEGPKMPCALVDWYKNKFTDPQVEEIARSIVESGCSYKNACLKWGYNLTYDGQYAQSGNRVYFRLQKVVSKLNARKKRQQNQRTSQMLKEANELNVTTAKKLVEVQQEKENLFTR